MTKIKIKKIILLVVVLMVLIVLIVLIFNRPSRGQWLGEPSQRALEMVAEEKNASQSEIKNECFQTFSKLPLTNIRLNVENESCAANASVADLKAFISIKVEKREEGFKFEELPGLTLRQQDQDTYQLEIISVPQGYESYTYSSDNDLVTFLWQEPVLITMSTYDFLSFEPIFIENMETMIKSLSLEPDMYLEDEQLPIEEGVAN